MRNLNPRSFKGLSEAIVRHLANQPRREVGFPRPTERTNERVRLRPETTFWPVLLGKGLNQIGDRYPMTGDQGGIVNIHPPPKDLRKIWCFQCNKVGHIKRVELKLVCETRENAFMNQWTWKAKLNGRAVKVWLDSGCTKLLVHTNVWQKERDLDGTNPMPQQVPEKLGSQHPE